MLNERKTKYMKINKNITHFEQDLIIGGQFQIFACAGTMINSKNLISEEIKSRTAAGNRRFHSLGQRHRTRATSKEVKI